MPADYNNDIAVFRDGAWPVVGFQIIYYGLDGDIPLPLSQAVYRKSF
ncbi:MAG TPA: hypothetical protein VEU28_09345 [Actinomycetota bacterium]|nr:hypothetical protein [Actinomycetota bacterium]